MANEKFLINIDKGLLKCIREKAQKNNRSVNNYIETVLMSATGYKTDMVLNWFLNTEPCEGATQKLTQLESDCQNKNKNEGKD